MRTERWVGVVTIVGTMLAAPATASADGGAYLDLDRTHYLPGQTARAEGYVSVPVAKQDLLERGPFYLYVISSRSAVTEGRPLPGGAVRVAEITIEPGKGTTFELHASFVVPDLAGASYGLGVCNDPCTISGFREPLTGAISIVATAREGRLLTRVSRLSGENWGLHRKVRKAERANDELRARLTAAEVARSAIAIDLREATEAGGTPNPIGRRPVIPAWSAATIALGLLALAISIVVRARRRIVPCDHVPEHDPTQELVVSR
ncbi:MAG TPA: hypothetical protein VLE71_05530 [Actinomycetota bacterium]|nr:hypothetical protein [Actinomycetota bacterium]